MSNRRLLCMLTTLFLPALAAADDGAWSEVRVGAVADDKRMESDVIVVAINGSRDVRTASVYTLPPGAQQLRIASKRRVAGGVITSQLLVLELRPCMRYELAADHARNADQGGWRPIVKAEVPIPDCVRTFGAPPAVAIGE